MHAPVTAILPAPVKPTLVAKLPHRRLERKRALSRALTSFRKDRNSSRLALRGVEETKYKDEAGEEDEEDEDDDDDDDDDDDIEISDEEYLEISARIAELAGSKGYLNKEDCKIVFGIKDDAFLERIVEIMADEEEGGVRIRVERFTEEVALLLGANTVSKLVSREQGSRGA